MPGPVEIDPAESAIAYFAWELRRLRTEAGLTQKQLADQLHYAVSYVGMLETAARVPSEQFCKLCDEELNGQGVLTRLWPLVNREAYPKNFRAFVDLEKAATSVCGYETQLVPGLLQTEAYIRAMLARWNHADPEAIVAARLDRQHILEQIDSPSFSFVLDEAVLWHLVGDAEVMRAQLGHIMEMSLWPNILVQVLPLKARAHADLGSSLHLLSFSDGPDVASVEFYGESQLIGTADVVAKCRLSYARCCADALDPAASRDMIASLLKDPNPWDTPYRT